MQRSFTAIMNRTIALFISIILLTQIASYSLNDIQPQIDREEILQEDSALGVSGRNNSSSGPMEWVSAWPGSSNYSTNDIVNISWSAGDLATNITYNVTVDIYAHNVTTNTTYVIWDDFTVFNSSSFNSSSGVWSVPSATLPTGCYFVSVSVFDNNDGMHLANDGFELGIGMDCSNTGGNGSGNGPMESLFAWTDYSNYSSSDDIDLKWNATSLNLSANYNVAVDVYGHDPTTNTNSIVWSDDSVFNPTTHGNGEDWFHDGFTITAGTLSTGCYYASFNLTDDDDGMFFANTGFEFGVNMDCSTTGGNNTGGNITNATGLIDIDTGWYQYYLGDTVTIQIESYNLTSFADYEVYWYITPFENQYPMMNGTYDWQATSNMNLTTHTFSPTSNGTYCIYAFLYHNHHPWLDMDDTCIVFGNPEWIEVMFYTDGTPGHPYHHFDDADDVSFNMTMYGLDSGENYNMSYSLSHMNFTGGWIDVYLPSDIGFTGTTWGSHSVYVLNGTSGFDPSIGTWGHEFYDGCWNLDVELFDDAHQLVAAHWGEMFTVGDNNSCDTGGNNNAGNNNGTARFLYIKPLAQNADQNTPFSLTFPALPMAGGSPYLSNMICSKAAGHSADVWETYVPMPYNNITSWKVENTYGLVMGMFVMYDAQAAGIYTMQNPTVIFEQNLSFNGHAPSVIVDQAYFDCPVVTVSSSLSPVSITGGGVISYVAGLSVDNSGDWTGELHWDVTTVTAGSSTALADIGGHLMIEHTGALLDHDFSPTGVTADEICLNWELIDENDDELSSGSNCINFIPIDEDSEDDCEAWEYWNPDMVDPSLPGNGCPHYTADNDSTSDDDDDDDSSGALPAVGVFGTLAASMLAVFIVAIKRDEE
jgi:hypothetical protein